MDAILYISKCSMMPEWHHLDSSKTCDNALRSRINKKTLISMIYCSVIIDERLFLYSIIMLLSLNDLFVQHCSVIHSECLFLYSIILLLPLNARICTVCFRCCLRMLVLYRISLMLALSLCVCTVLFYYSLRMPVSVQQFSAVCF